MSGTSSMRGRAVLHVPATGAPCPYSVGDHVEGALVTNVLQDPYRDEWHVLLRGPMLPECAEGAIPMSYRSIYDLRVAIQDLDRLR